MQVSGKRSAFTLGAGEEHTLSVGPQFEFKISTVKNKTSFISTFL